MSELEKKLINLSADSWYRVPNSKMMHVCAPESFGVRGVLGCTAVVMAWSGGAWDPVHRKMLVWGGGHADYLGNEMYAFDVPTMKWQRLTDPSPGPYNRDPLADDRPVSRHTYDGLQYLPDANRFFAVGGSRSSDGGGTGVTWLFDVEKRRWTHPDPKGPSPGGYTQSSAYDPVDKRVFVRANIGLYEYDIRNNAWTQLMDFRTVEWPRYENSGEKRGLVDTRRNLFWSMGGGDYVVWDIRGGRLVTDNWVTTGGGEYVHMYNLRPLFKSGGGEIHNARAPGADYDSKADAIVAWKGGGPWVLDLATRTWRRKNGSGAPPAQEERGTYGRWRYLPQYNVFILVNSIGDDVFFYKHTAGGPQGERGR